MAQGNGAGLIPAGWASTIGLETHVQLGTQSKLFCGCPTEFGAPPNTQVCPICGGYPGVLPVVNRGAVELAVRAGLALNCAIAPRSVLARKNYFYPDLPKAYQISQYAEPICRNGYLDISLVGGQEAAPTRTRRGEAGGVKRVRILRAHLEEDAGKLIHVGGQDAAPTRGGGLSLVDLNRCGVPLLEIVTEPDLASPEEAYAYLIALKAVLQYAGVSECNMEQGSLRCDANISLARQGAGLGTKVEIKNLNSFKAVKASLEYEITRQARALESGGRIVQETRLWDADKGETAPMRSKEEAHDYRYFPEPDLPPLVVDPGLISQQRDALPEMPAPRRERFQKEYGLPAYDAGVLTAERDLADYFEAVVAIAGVARAKPAANWVMGDLLGALNSLPADQRAGGNLIRQGPVSPNALAELLGLLDGGTLSGTMAKEVLAMMVETGRAPGEIVKERGLAQVSDEGSLGPIIQEVIRDNPSSVDAYRKGKTAALGRLVGEVMKKTKGRANPRLVNSLLEAALRRGQH